MAKELTEIEQLKAELAAMREQISGQSNVTAIQKELIDAKNLIAEMNPVKPRLKPYTEDEVAALNAKGHTIGATGQKLSENHKPLPEWELWIVEIRVKDIGTIPETGNKWSVPDTLTLLKREKSGMKGEDVTFQFANKQIDFRFPSTEHRFTLLIPKGEGEPNKIYQCGYWVETVYANGKAVKMERMLVNDIPRITGAPTDKNLWGKG